MNTRARLRQLGTELREKGLPAYVVRHAPDVRYLTGFTGSNGAVLLLERSGRWQAQLFTDGRYTAQARQEVSAARVRITKGPVQVELCEALVREGVSGCGYDPAVTTVASLEAMREALRKAGMAGREAKRFLLPAAGIVTELRTVKDADEVERMRRAAALTSQLYEGMLSFMESGMREVDVAAELEHRARRAGAEGMSFETIVAAGERSSLPHGRATAAPLRPGDLVTLDFGIILDGYCSDMTRTVFLGRDNRRVPPAERAADGEKRRVFEAVLEAQRSAASVVRAGVTAAEVDGAARQVLQRAGLGRAFSHSTGHGVGLEIHEAPRLAANQEQVLRSGMTLTVEPGAYLPGRFGVRIEDTVLVTETGCEVLTPAFKGWTEL